MVKRMPEGKNDGWTTIRVSMAVYNKLNKMGKTEDTFDDVLRRVLRLPQRNWLEANIKELERKITTKWRSFRECGQKDIFYS